MPENDLVFKYNICIWLRVTSKMRKMFFARFKYNICIWLSLFLGATAMCMTNLNTTFVFG